MKQNGDGPVVGLDLDGTLGDYHGHFLRFAEGWLGREMPDPATINPGLPLHKFMKTSKTTYRRIKLAYREGGMKRSMPCYSGARALAMSLRQEFGCEVWITTSRPYLAHGPIEGDTKHWLKRNGIQYDHVLWGEHKYRTLRRWAGNRVVAVLEDLPVMAEQAIGVGIPVLLRDQPYNTWWDPEEILATRVLGLSSALDAFDVLYQKWKTNNK